MDWIEFGEDELEVLTGEAIRMTVHGATIREMGNYIVDNSSQAAKDAMWKEFVTEMLEWGKDYRPALFEKALPTMLGESQDKTHTDKLLREYLAHLKAEEGVT